ncbi:MAG: tetratricopeptide repeat protein, partial [Planctomycetota bacterium]|nr:tetratricopeptide repeat protein [Planctomycetota bacterium]
AAGPDSSLAIVARNNVGVVLQRLDRFDEASVILGEVLETRRRVLGSDHHQTMHSAHTLADLRRRQERFIEAASLYREALEGRAEHLGATHPDTRASAIALAETLADLDNRAEAETILQNTRAALTSAESPDDRAIASIDEALARIRAGATTDPAPPGQ